MSGGAGGTRILRLSRRDTALISRHDILKMNSVAGTATGRGTPGGTTIRGTEPPKAAKAKTPAEDRCPSAARHLPQVQSTGSGRGEARSEHTQYFRCNENKMHISTTTLHTTRRHLRFYLKDARYGDARPESRVSAENTAYCPTPTGRCRTPTGRLSNSNWSIPLGSLRCLSSASGMCSYCTANREPSSARLARARVRRLCSLSAPRLCLHRLQRVQLLTQLSLHLVETPFTRSLSCVFRLVGHPLGRFDATFSTLLRPGVGSF